MARTLLTLSNRILVPNNYPSHKQTLVTACGMRAPHAVHALPQLLPQLSANSEASVTLEGIKASMWDLLASGELEEFAVTIVEYGFGPSLTIPVILMWSLHFPECLNDFSTPIILQRYNISLCRRGVATTPMSIGTLPGPPLSLSTSHFEAQGNSPRVQRDPVAAGSSARDIALSYLHGRETDPVKISERTTFFYSRMEPNDNEPRAPLEHGSNISSVQGEERGSLGVFLAPLSRPMESYLLSAQHVFSGPIGSAVQTFSHLDTLRRLAQIARCKNMPTAEQEAKFAFTLRLPYRNVATLTKSLFGVDAKGWRKDWALCRISDGYAGVNGRFTMDQERNLRMALKLDDKCVFRDGLGVAKAIEGSKVFKVGATTGITGGVVNKTNVCVYSRDTAEAEIDIQNPAPSDTLTMILPLPGVNIPFCAGGDSGAGVFACNKGRFSWVGLLVAMAPVEMVDGVLTKNIGLMVPQDVILSQIEKETGTKWGLYRGRRKWPGPLWPSGYLGFILCLILVLLIC